MADDDIRELYRLLRDLTSSLSAVAARIDAHVARGEMVEITFKESVDGILVEIQKNHGERKEELSELKGNIEKFNDALSRTKGGMFVLVPIAMVIGWAVEHFWKGAK